LKNVEHRAEEEEEGKTFPRSAKSSMKAPWANWANNWKRRIQAATGSRQSEPGRGIETANAEIHDIEEENDQLPKATPEEGCSGRDGEAFEKTDQSNGCSHYGKDFFG
jgi:hypothetical protein